MTHLSEIFDPALLDAAIADRLERADGPLRILNYTRSAAYGRVWNDATSTVGGLIVDRGNQVVARPSPKFFGPHEPDAPEVPVSQPTEVTEKLDGVLGIAYLHPEDGVRVATRGSLTSDQAAAATRIWRDKYAHAALPDTATALFEIIDPAHRIVVDYGQQRDLVLLAVIDPRHRSGPASREHAVARTPRPGCTTSTRSLV